jgi:hypothetical protein
MSAPDPESEPSDAMQQGRLEPREAPSEPRLAGDDRGRRRRGFEGAGRVAELVLTKLGHLDPREGREGPAGGDEIEPG